MSLTESSKSRRWTRRAVLRWSVGASIVGSVAAVGYSWLIEPHWIHVVRRDLAIATLPNSLIGKTLIQISDLHIGPVVDDQYISSAIKYVCSLQPDILVITGDFMTSENDEQIGHVERILQNLEPARLVTLGILGNHDYSGDFSQRSVADKLAARLANVGINVLRNEICDVEGMQFVGLDDLWGPCFDGRILSDLEPNKASLVLCHNPDAADRPIWAGYQGWILCGHTHGGQCRLPFFNPPIIPVKNKRFTQGEIDLHDGRKLYINPGLGYLRRVRFNVRPEITVFTLTGA